MKKFYGVLAVLLLAGCAADKAPSDLPVENLYNNAFDDLQKTKYKKAAEEFEQVEIEHPYSQWAVKAKLMGAYAYYKNEDYDDAVLALDRFIKYHPGNKDVAYAYYLKGMCYYNQISSADKDQADTEKAEEAFNRLILLFPNSEYAADARKKVNLTEDYKAGQEMIIGRYYLNNGNYLSALNRFNVVLENYQTTVQIEEALYRQVEIYGILGLNKYAAGYYKILHNNYPDGMWTAKAAKVMDKIGNSSIKKEVAPKKEVEEVKTETPGSWFNWFKSDEQSEVKAETPKPVEEVKTETSGSWFNWFKSDEQSEVKAETPKPVEEVKAETSGSWFNWFKSDEQSEVKAETPKPVEEVKAETSGSWFSWFKSDEQPEVKVEAPKKEAEEVKAETSSSWFGWFKSDEQPQREEEDTSSSWFSWFKSDEQPDEAIEEIAVEVEEEQPQTETVKTEEDKPANSVKVSHKTQVGDIISSNRKGKK